MSVWNSLLEWSNILSGIAVATMYLTAQCEKESRLVPSVGVLESAVYCIAAILYSDPDQPPSCGRCQLVLV